MNCCSSCLSRSESLLESTFTEPRVSDILMLRWDVARSCASESRFGAGSVFILHRKVGGGREKGNSGLSSTSPGGELAPHECYSPWTCPHMAPLNLRFTQWVQSWLNTLDSQTVMLWHSELPSESVLDNAREASAAQKKPQNFRGVIMDAQLIIDCALSDLIKEAIEIQFLTPA
jgi:hypothetical protein